MDRRAFFKFCAVLPLMRPLVTLRATSEMEWEDIEGYLRQRLGLPIRVHITQSCAGHEDPTVLKAGHSPDTCAWCLYTREWGRCVALWRENGKQAAALVKWYRRDEITAATVAAALEDFIPQLIREGNHLVPSGRLWLDLKQQIRLIPGSQAILRETLFEL